MIEKDLLLGVRNVSVCYKSRRSFFRSSEFLALNDISFDIYKGETLGILGRNGCGKSTLLKLLAGIYAPDKGVIKFHNKSSSLLTLGLGFDNELSGYDNALISSMLMGATKQQARMAIEEIIEFSELGPFINQPVKTYSSGMRARLGFSVAMSMDVELLLIDEVLGVGDAHFRKKAEKRMLEKFNSNQSIVFVSHNAEQVKRLCDRAIFLDQGVLKFNGSVDETHRFQKEYFS